MQHVPHSDLHAYCANSIQFLPSSLGAGYSAFLEPRVPEKRCTHESISLALESEPMGLIASGRQEEHAMPRESETGPALGLAMQRREGIPCIKGLDPRVGR